MLGELKQFFSELAQPPLLSSNLNFVFPRFPLHYFHLRKLGCCTLHRCKTPRSWSTVLLPQSSPVLSPPSPEQGLNSQSINISSFQSFSVFKSSVHFSLLPEISLTSNCFDHFLPHQHKKGKKCTPH